MLEKHHQRPHPRRGGRGGGRAVAPLHPGRQLPDKAVSLLDTACARVAVSQYATPAEVEDCRRRIEALDDRAGDRRARAAVGVEHGDTPQRASTSSAGASASRPRSVCETRWQDEKAIVDEIASLRRSCEATAGRAASRARRRAAGRARGRPRARSCAELREQRAGRELQGESPLVHAGRRRARRSPRSSPAGPASRSARWCTNEIETVLTLERHARASASSARSTRSRRSPSASGPRGRGLDDPRRPIGVFLLVGPSRRRQDRDGAGAGRHRSTAASAT